MTPFDPYYQWLGIRDSQRPPNHYRLLGLDLHEEDSRVIATAADRQMAHLRTFQNGPHSAESQRLLNEVSEARVCLLDPTKKSAYDAWLTAQLGPLVDVKGRADDGPRDESPRIRIQKSNDSIELQRPGRGNRDRAPLKWVLAATGAVLALSAGTFYYRYQMDHPAELVDSAAGTPPATLPETGELEATSRVPPRSNGPADASSSELSGETSGAIERTVDVPSGDSKSAEEASSRGRDGSLVGGTADGAGLDAHVVNPHANASTSRPPDMVASNDRPSATASAATGLPPLDWNPEDYSVGSEESLRMPTSGPLGLFLKQLSERQLDATRQTMTQWLKAGRSPLNSVALADLELIFDTLDQFWSAVDSQVTTLQVGDSFRFRSWDVRVAQRNGLVLTLESATGKTHPFELQRATMHPDIAIGLVERQFSNSPGTAFRLIGFFLLLDRNGSQSRARDYFRRATELGFSAAFLEETVHHYTQSVQ